MSVIIQTNYVCFILVFWISRGPKGKGGGPTVFLAQRPNPNENMVYGTLRRVDYNLTLCRLQSRLQHIYHG